MIYVYLQDLKLKLKTQFGVTLGCNADCTNHYF